MEKYRVLFLCTGNSARSQMAEALLRHHANEEFEVHSAGLDPQGVHPLTIEVMQEMGIDISGQTSKSLRQDLGHTRFSYVVTVCDHAEKNCPVAFLNQGHHLHWAFEDPASIIGSDNDQLIKFREVRDKIDQCIREWVRERQ